MNKYLRKIAAVLSLTLVLTSFDCTALRAVNTAEINAVSSDYDKLTKQGDANKTDQTDTAEPNTAQPNTAEPNAAKADGAAKKQAATKQDEGKAESAEATKTAKEPSTASDADAQPNYIVAEPVTGNKNDKGRSKRSRRSVSDLDRAAYEDRSEIGMDRSAPEAGNDTTCPSKPAPEGNGLLTYGSAPAKTDGGLEKGEEADPKITEPDGAYLNRHLPLQARYLGDPIKQDAANKQVKNEAPPATYSYKMHFVLIRTIYKSEGEGENKKIVPTFLVKEFHKPYQITVGEDDLAPSVNGTRFVLPQKEGYAKPVVINGAKKRDNDDVDKDIKGKAKEELINKNKQAKVDYTKIVFEHSGDASVSNSTRTLPIKTEVAKNNNSHGYSFNPTTNQYMLEQTFVYMPNDAKVTISYQKQSTKNMNEFEAVDETDNITITSSIGADYVLSHNELYPAAKGNNDTEKKNNYKELREGYRPELENVHFLVPEADEGQFKITLRLLRNTGSAVFDSNGGDPLPTRTFAYDQPIIFPSPKREGYNFLGWRPNKDIAYKEKDGNNEPKGPKNFYKVTGDNSIETVENKLLKNLNDEEKKNIEKNTRARIDKEITNEVVEDLKYKYKQEVEEEIKKEYKQEISEEVNQEIKARWRKIITRNTESDPAAEYEKESEEKKNEIEAELETYLNGKLKDTLKKEADKRLADKVAEIMPRLLAKKTQEDVKKRKEKIEEDIVKRIIPQAKLDRAWIKPGSETLRGEYKNKLLYNDNDHDHVYLMPANGVTFTAVWATKERAKYTYSYWLEKPDDPKTNAFSDKYVFIDSKDSKEEVPTFKPFDEEWVKKLGQDEYNKIRKHADSGNYDTKFYEWDDLASEYKNSAKFNDFFEFDEEATVKENAGMYVTGDDRADCKIIFKRRRYTVVFTSKRNGDTKENSGLYAAGFGKGATMTVRKGSTTDKLGNLILVDKLSLGKDVDFHPPEMEARGVKGAETFVANTKVELKPQNELSEAERKVAPYQFTARFGQNLDKVWPNPYENCKLSTGESNFFLGWCTCSTDSKYRDTPPYSLSPKFLYDCGEYYEADRRGYYNMDTKYKDRDPNTWKDHTAPNIIALIPDFVAPSGQIPVCTLFYTQSLDGTKYAVNPHWKLKVDTYVLDYHFPLPELTGFTSVGHLNEKDKKKKDEDKINPTGDGFEGSDGEDNAETLIKNDLGLKYTQKYIKENYYLPNKPFKNKWYEGDNVTDDHLDDDYPIEEEDIDENAILGKINYKIQEDKFLGNKISGEEIWYGNVFEFAKEYENEWTGMRFLNAYYARNRYPITIQNIKNPKEVPAFYDAKLEDALHLIDQPLTDTDRPENIQKTWEFEGYTFDKNNKYPVDGYTMPDNPITVFAKWVDPNIYNFTIDLAGGWLEGVPPQEEVTDAKWNNTLYKQEENNIKIQTVDKDGKKSGEETVDWGKIDAYAKNNTRIGKVTYQIKSGGNIRKELEQYLKEDSNDDSKLCHKQETKKKIVPVKPGYKFFGWQVVRYKINKKGEYVEDTSYKDVHKADELFSFGSPVAGKMDMRAIWIKDERVPVYFEHHYYNKQGIELGWSKNNEEKPDFVDLSDENSKDLKQLREKLQKDYQNTYPKDKMALLQVKPDALPKSNIAAMAKEDTTWVLVSNEKDPNNADGASELEKLLGDKYEKEITNKFIQNKPVDGIEEKDGKKVVPPPTVFKFYYQPFKHRFYYKTYKCVDDSGDDSGGENPKLRYQIMREPEKVHNDNFDYDVINYKPIHGYKLYYVPKTQDGAQAEVKKDGRQRVGKFEEDPDGTLKINGVKSYNFDFEYKDYRVLVRNSEKAETPYKYHRVVFELDKNMEFVTNYQGAFNGIAKDSKLKDIVGQKETKTISDLLGMGDELVDSSKDEKVCTRRYIVDVADGVDDANIPLPPIRPVRFLPVSLRWIDQDLKNVYNGNVPKGVKAVDVVEEDLEANLDEALPPKPKAPRKITFDPNYEVKLLFTATDDTLQDNNEILPLKENGNLKNEGKYEEQPAWSKVMAVRASQNLVCQRVSGSKRKDATEPKALTDGTLTRSKILKDLEKDHDDCIKEDGEGGCKLRSSDGEGKWIGVNKPSMNKLELTDFADLTAPKDDEKFKPAAEKQDGVPIWQKKPYQLKTIKVSAKGSDAPAASQEDCCNIQIDENNPPTKSVWTMEGLDKLKAIDNQLHDIIKFKASEVGAEEETDGVETGIFVEHDIFINNQKARRLFEITYDGDTENGLNIYNWEVPTIDVEVHKYWFGKYGQPLDFNTLSVGMAANPKPLTMEMRFMDPRVKLKPRTADLTAANKWHDWIRNVRLKFRSISHRIYDYELHEIGESGGTLSYGGKKFDAIYIGRCLDGFKVINREQTYGFPPVVAICDCARMGMNKAYTAANSAYTAVSEAAGKAGNYIKRQVGKIFGGNGRQTETNGQGGCSSCHLD